MDPLSSEVQWSALGVEYEAVGEQRQSSLVTPGEAPFLDGRIDILNKNSFETSPTQQVYRTASAILALVRVSAFARLSPMDSHGRPESARGDRQQRFRAIIRILFQSVRDSEDRNPREGYGRSKRVCEDGTQGTRKVRRLAQPCTPTVSNNLRLSSEIERTLRGWADAPHTERNNENVCDHKPEIQRILGVLTTQESAPGVGGPGVGERSPRLAPVVPHDTATVSISGESGASLAPPPPTSCGTLIAPPNSFFHLNSNRSAFGLLIGRAFDPRELPLLVEAIFSNKDERDTIRRLRGDDAQIFIDLMDEARSAFAHHRDARLTDADKALDRPDLPSRTRKKCLKLLYRTCSRNALLPSALKIPPCYDRTSVALCRGGFADVWKGMHCGRDVAVKVLRTYLNSDLKRIIGVGYRSYPLPAC